MHNWQNKSIAKGRRGALVLLVNHTSDKEFVHPESVMNFYKRPIKIKAWAKALGRHVSKKIHQWLVTHAVMLDITSH